MDFLSFKSFYFITIFVIVVFLLWFSQSTLDSVSTNSFHFITIFVIVVFLLWFSQSTEYEEEVKHTAGNFKLFLFLLPFLLMLIFVLVYSTRGRLHFPFLRPEYEMIQQAGGVPWRAVMFLVLILVLLSYQSSFRVKWFGPLSRS
jgi:ABC-type xylose transport system permease subunit